MVFNKIYGGYPLRIAFAISMLSILLMVGGVNALPAEQWNKTFGGTTSYEQARSVQQTSDDGYILACDYLNPPGSTDFLLIKTDSYGAMQWNKTFGGTGVDSPESVRQTSDGGYILAGDTTSFGAGNSDAWLIKTDANGIMQWNKTFGGTSNDYARSVQETSDGGYIIAGSTASFGGGYFDAWLIKTDANGIIQWSKTFGGINYEGARSVQQTSDGGYILAGENNGPDFWLVKTDASGNMQWNRTFGGTGNDVAYSVKNTLDGGYILAGFTYSFGAGYTDAWLVKTNASGDEQWDRTFGGASMDRAYSVQQTLDGGYVLTGDTGGADAWLIKTNSIGNEQWNRTFGKAMNTDGAYSVQQTSDGGYILAGHTDYVNPTGPSDAWLIKISDDTTQPVITIDSCTIISSPGGYLLGQNILDSGASSCINVTSSNVIFDGAGHTIDGIDAENSYGMYVYNSTTYLTNVTIKNLTVTDWYEGIYYKNTQNGSIDNNTANSNIVRGIYLNSSSNNTLSSNNANSNILWGIYLDYSSDNNNLSGNNANSNFGYGLRLNSSSNNTLTRNNASGNNHGITLSFSSNNNIVSLNNASNNNIYGISLETNNNNLTGNIVSNNSVSGIYLGDSNFNKIYNNIFNNTNNFEISYSNYNAWNTTKTLGINIIGGPYLGGNFWANPNRTGFSQICTDVNRDEICDSNYTLTLGYVDYLPLTIPTAYGYIYGTVSNNSVGIASAIVTTNTSINKSTDESGYYSILVPAGTYKLTSTSEPRFYPNNTVTVTVENGTSILQDIELLKKSTGNISGSVSAN